MNKWKTPLAESKVDFYLNAPRQIDINKLREKVDLPPISNIEEELWSIIKNTPLKSKSSKLMQQLQQKKLKSSQLSSNQTWDNWSYPQSWLSKSSISNKPQSCKLNFLFH